MTGIKTNAWCNNTTAQPELPIVGRAGFQRAHLDAGLVQPGEGRSAGGLAAGPVAALVVADPLGGLLVDGRPASRRVALGLEVGVDRFLHLLDGEVLRVGRFFFGAADARGHRTAC